jgi:hypothetical protein
MAKHLMMHSIFQRDGKNVIMNLSEWGTQTLQGEELEKFVQDMNYWDAKQALLPSIGYTKITLITEEITNEDGEKEEIEVGVTSEFATNCMDELDLWETFDPEKLYPFVIDEYFDKMSQDPTIVVFNRIQRTE